MDGNFGTPAYLTFPFGIAINSARSTTAAYITPINWIDITTPKITPIVIFTGTFILLSTFLYFIPYIIATIINISINIIIPILK